MLEIRRFSILCMSVLFGIEAYTATPSPAHVEVVKQGTDHYALHVDGKPYHVHGITFSKPREGESLDDAMRDIASMGCNTVRTWDAKNKDALLQAAHAHGLKVVLGLWLYHPRPSNDSNNSFNWYDAGGKEKLFKQRMRSVERYRNHPALLMWGVGNEVILHMRNDEEKKTYCQFVERLCKEIHKVDPHHPTTSASAHVVSWKHWAKHCPSLDIFGSNVYGNGRYLPRIMRELKLDKPFLVTELGPRGSWLAPSDRNGMKVDATDVEKYETITGSYKTWIKPSENCLGVCTFNYTDGLSDCHVVLTSFVSASRRPLYWATREAFTGKPPTNPLPSIAEFELGPDTAGKGQWIEARLVATDADATAVTFHWYDLHGNPWRTDGVKTLESVGDLARGFAVRAPERAGLAKVYAFVRDAAGNLSVATTSMIVTDEPSPQALSQPPERLTRRPEPVKKEPVAIAPPPSRPKASEEARSMFTALLVERAVAAAGRGHDVSFTCSVARQRVTVRGADESQITVRGTRMPVDMSFAWNRLNDGDLRSLALGLLRTGNKADHAVVAFFMKVVGEEDLARDHLARAGEYAALVEHAFAR